MHLAKVSMRGMLRPGPESLLLFWFINALHLAPVFPDLRYEACWCFQLPSSCRTLNLWVSSILLNTRHFIHRILELEESIPHDQTHSSASRQNDNKNVSEREWFSSFVKFPNYRNLWSFLFNIQDLNVIIISKFSYHLSEFFPANQMLGVFFFSHIVPDEHRNI